MSSVLADDGWHREAAPQIEGEDPLALVRAEIAEGLALRFREHARQRIRDAGQRAPKPGEVDWALVNALALDPLEGWRLANLIGVVDVAGEHEAGALEWWPSPAEPALEFALPDRALFLGDHTGRSWDTLTHAWSRDPIELLTRLLGIRPGQAAFRICRAFGLEVPHVR